MWRGWCSACHHVSIHTPLIHVEGVVVQCMQLSLKRLVLSRGRDLQGGGVSTTKILVAAVKMAVPSWKLALLERKKKQEEEEKAKQAKEEEAKIASLPAWKRAIIMREKQGKTTPASTNSETTSPKWQVAVERVKGADSPILNQKQQSWTASKAAPPPSPAQQRAPPSSPKPTTSKPTSTDSPVLSRWKHISTASDSSKKEAPKKLTASHSFSVRASPATSKSSSVHEAPSTFNTSSGSSTPAASISSSVHATPAASLSSTSASQEEDDPNLAKLPAWKKALILKKRKTQKPVNEEAVASTSEERPDSVTLNSKEEKDISTGAVTKTGPRQPEVVNRSTGEGFQRLVEQEGKTLHPPVYKEVDEWANVHEQDAKFIALPLWKQALIRRRREDIAKRSGLPVPTATAITSDQEPQTSPLVKKADQTAKKTNNKKGQTAPTNAIENKKTSKTVSHERKKKVASDKPSNRHGKDKQDTKPVSKAASKPASKPMTKPVTKAPAPPAKKEELTFTYSFSKSSTSHRTLDTGGSSSDATDSDLEDAVITNLDDESDEDDSGIVLQSYSVSKTSSQPSPTLGSKSISDTLVKNTSTVKSAVSTPGKKKHMRRVSWSDTQLVSEHYYPKYDYSDYDDIEREEDNKNRFLAALAKENSGLSHRLHPSLRRNNDTDGYGYGGFSPTSPASRSTTTENSLGSFVPKTLSGHSPQMFSGYTDPEVKKDDKQAEQNGLPEELETVQEQTDDFYANFTSSNTAALLW